MSGLTKKVIYADKILSTLLGVKEETLVSYAEISKGLHKYIKEKNLKNPQSVRLPSPPFPPILPAQPPTEQAVERVSSCRDCGEPIPAGAVFCDMCGVRQ